MKKLSYLFAAALAFVGCSNNKDEPTSLVDVLNVSSISLENTNEMESETIEKSGFKIFELKKGSKIFLQESIWTNENGKWASNSSMQGLKDACRMVAVYPANVVQEEGTFKLLPGENNMTAVQLVDREKTSTVAFGFSHRMAKLSMVAKKSSGKNIPFGQGNGEITKVVLNQPSELICNLVDASLMQLGESKDVELSINEMNYIIPGGKEYTFKVEYKNINGEIVSMSSVTRQSIKRDKKYELAFIVNDNNLELEINEVDWNKVDDPIEDVVEPTPVDNSPASINGVYYRLNSDNTAIVTNVEGNKYEGEIIIPSSVTHNGRNFSVTRVGVNTFAASNVTKVVLPESILTIGEKAFNQCDKLKEVNIPSKVKVIESGTFSMCPNIKKIQLPKGLVEIKEFAFAFCNPDGVVIPASVKKIGAWAFAHNRLKKVVFEDSEETLELSAENEKFVFDQSLIIKAYIGRNVTNFASYDNTYTYCITFGKYVTEWRDEYNAVFNSKPGWLSCITVKFTDPKQFKPNFDEETYKHKVYTDPSSGQKTGEKALYVPVGYKEKFKNDPYWGKFENIVEGEYEI